MVLRLRNRDTEAWSRVVDLYGQLVFYWCRRSNLQPADAADILQNVFAAVTSSIDGYESRDQGNFRGWLWTITRNKINDHFRGVQRGGEAAGGTSAQVQMAEVPDRSAERPPSEADVLNAFRRHSSVEVTRKYYQNREGVLDGAIDAMYVPDVAKGG